MTVVLEDELRKKAHFVSGKSSWFRAATDRAAESAVHDAEELLSYLDSMDEPAINAGTTAHPERILTMTWLIGGAETIRSISVSCRGFGEFDVSWDDRQGQQHKATAISLAKVLGLDLPEKLAALKKGHLSGSAPPSGPALF